MKRKKVAVIASSRATYGYKKRIIKMIRESDKLELQLIVTGMHLLKEHGYSVEEIEKDGHLIAAKVDMMVGGEHPAAWAKSIGVEIQGLAQVFQMLDPDLVLVTGDRAEMLGAAVTAAYMNKPVAHIQAGDLSGHIDGAARHAITKLSHIHFPSCEDSATRVERMGEEPWRIFNVGAPQLDDIVHSERLSTEELGELFGLDFDSQIVLVIQHPVLVENTRSRQQMVETLEAVKALGLPAMVIYPNVDAGKDGIIEVIKSYERIGSIRAFKNLDRQVFLSVLSSVSVLVGNSSCGILEAPTLKLPVVNIGNRQRGRMQANNVINVGYDRGRILQAMKKALYDEDFKKALASCVNPYGDGNSSEKIVEVLENIEVNSRLLDKRMTY